MLEATLRISQLPRLFSRNRATFQIPQRFQSTYALPPIPPEAVLAFKHKLPSRGRPMSLPIVSTLIPEKLTKENYVDFTKKITAGIFVPITYTQTCLSYPVGRALLFFMQRGDNPRGGENSSRKIVNPSLTTFLNGVWPSNAHGFLYYHSNPSDSDPTTSGIRFRVTPSNDPADFDKGTDLTFPNGLPWELSTSTIIASSRYAALRYLLVDEGLLAGEEVKKYEEQALKGQYFRYTHLYSFDQPFPVKFDARTRRISAFHNGIFARAGGASWFMEKAGINTRFPFKGDGIAQMETTFNKRKCPAMQLRILKINSLQVDPNYNGRLVTPEEGELVKINYVNGPQPKMYRIDRDTGLGSVAALLLNGDKNKLVTVEQVKARK